MAFLALAADNRGMANVWVNTSAGNAIRHDRIVGLSAEKVQGGWGVIGHRPGKDPPVVLAVLGRGGRAREGARRLCNELPLAIAAAGKDGQGRTVTFVKNGYPKGDGQWSTLAATVAAVRPIPVVKPGETRQRRRDTG